MPAQPRPVRRSVVMLLVLGSLVLGTAACGGAPATEPTEQFTSATAFDLDALRHPAGRMLGVVSTEGPWESRAIDTFTAESGHTPGIREYYLSWGNSFDTAGNTDLWHDRGILPMVEWGPDATSLREIGSGTDDSYIRTFARQVKAYQGPLVLSFGGEMNGPWNSWGPHHAKPADFVRAWRRVHDVFREEGVANVIWTWKPHVVDSGSPAKLKPYFPGADYVDWVGLIGYYGPLDGVAFDSLFTPTMRQIRTFSSAPVLIAETGVAQSSFKAQQIKDLFTGAAAAGVIGVVWYDQVKTWAGSKSKEPMDWRIGSSLVSKAAFKIESARAGFDWSPSGR